MGSISKRRLKRRNRTSKLWVSMVVLVLVGVFYVRTFCLRSECHEYKEKQVRLEQQWKQEQSRTDTLNKEEKYRQTKKYVEDYAHNQLGLVYPGEIIFKSEK